VLLADHAEATTHQRFFPITFGVAPLCVTIAELNPPAVHRHTRHLGNLIGWTLLPLGKRKRLIGVGLLLGFLRPLCSYPLCPTLHSLP
jgi:hypothetical protein